MSQLTQHGWTICDITKQPDTPVGFEQLSTAGQLALYRPGPWHKEVRPNRARDDLTFSGKTCNKAASGNLGVGPLGLHLTDLSGKESGEAPEQGTRIIPMKENKTNKTNKNKKNGRSGPVNDHLLIDKQPTPNEVHQH